MAGVTGDLPDELPTAWVEHAAARAGEPVPTTFSEPSLAPHPADDEAGRVVAAVTDIVWG
jgi:hypothetical protein